MPFEQILALCSTLGVSTLINFFIQRRFSKKDEAEREAMKQRAKERENRDREREQQEQSHRKEFAELKENVNLGLETIRLLSSARVAEEAERLIRQGYATPNDRAYLKYLYENYKKWGWNGDMEERMHTVHILPPIKR